MSWSLKCYGFAGSTRLFVCKVYPKQVVKAVVCATPHQLIGYMYVWCRAISGGAISIDSAGSTGLVYVSMTRCNFTRNTAYQGLLAASPELAELQGAGGALRMFVAALWLNSTSFAGNSAASAGGAILLGQSCLQVSQSPNPNYTTPPLQCSCQRCTIHSRYFLDPLPMFVSHVMMLIFLLVSVPHLAPKYHENSTLL